MLSLRTTVPGFTGVLSQAGSQYVIPRAVSTVGCALPQPAAQHAELCFKGRGLGAVGRVQVPVQAWRPRGSGQSWWRGAQGNRYRARQPRGGHWTHSPHGRTLSGFSIM